MSTHQFADLQAFAREAPDFMMGIVRDVAREIHRQLHAETRSALEAIVPVGTGALKAAIHDEPASPQAAIDALQPTAVAITGSDKTWIINRGRKPGTRPFTVRGKHGTYTVKAGKMLGSTKASRGLRGPVLRKVRAIEERIVEAAIAKAEAGA